MACDDRESNIEKLTEAMLVAHRVLRSRQEEAREASRADSQARNYVSTAQAEFDTAKKAFDEALKKSIGGR
jgi:hypothetical protein